MEYMNKLAEERKKRGFTQEQIAEVLKTTTQYYQKYEKGKHPLPINHLITLCKFYHISADQILGLNDEEGKKENGTV